MKSNRLFKLLIGLLVGGVLAMVCMVGAVALWLVARGSSGEGGVTGDVLSNHIAIVGNDGNIWLAAPDNEEMQSITSDGGGYRFPTWAVDGHHLAFVGPVKEGNIGLYAYNNAREEADVLFNSPDSAPFYIYWSPDSQSVTFLTQEPSSLAMRLADADNPGTGHLMARGAPFYWVWSPEGDKLLMHVGGSRSVSEEAHLSFMDNREDAQRIELKLAPGGFQAPVWSNNGQYVFYIAADESGEEAIYRTEVVSEQQEVLTRLSGAAFMVLSPDDRHIAYLQLQRNGQFSTQGTAYIVGADGENERQVLEDWVVAMYWSPDGKRLALLTPAWDDDSPTARIPGMASLLAQENRFRWWIYDLETETVELLTTFVPTVEFLQTVPFFDQYHLSQTFWSPDSRYLLITKRNPGSQDGTVWIIDTRGQEIPRQLGNGTFAVWSWR